MDKSGIVLITDPFYMSSVPYPQIIVGCDNPRRNLFLVSRDTKEDVKTSKRFQDYKTGLHCFLFDLESIPNGHYLATSQYKAEDKLMERDVMILVENGQVAKAAVIRFLLAEKQAGAEIQLKQTR